MERPERIFEPFWQAKERRRAENRRAIVLPWLLWALGVAAALGLAWYAASS